MTSVQVRYIVHDVDAAIAFYSTHLGFHVDMHPAPAFAMLSRGELRLVLSAPNSQGGGGAPMPDGTAPEPGGWNRFAIQVDDLEAEVSRLTAAGVHFRNEIVTGVGGKQILVDDPSGNPVELFEPTRYDARLKLPGNYRPGVMMRELTNKTETVHRWYTRPVFFVADLNRAIRFYVETLGFEKAWHEGGGTGTVCQVNHGECEIILCEDATRSGKGRLFIELTAEALAELRSEFVERAVPTKETWWGYDTLQVDDPDGNELLFPHPE